MTVECRCTIVIGNNSLITVLVAMWHHYFPQGSVGECFKCVIKLSIIRPLKIFRINFRISQMDVATYEYD